MKRLSFVAAFIMIALTACPQKADQTFDAPVLFKKSALFLDTLKFKDGTFLLTAPIGGSIHNHDLLYKPLSWKADWNTDIVSKPTVFPPASHDHALLYKSITWHETWVDLLAKPVTFPPSAHTHDWTTGITGKPPEIELINELSKLPYSPLVQKTTAEINATVVPVGEVGLIWDKTLGVLKAWDGTKWKTFITNQ